MTKQFCTEFFVKINTDAALQQDFLQAIEGKEDESMLMDAAHSVVEVGTKYGYDFTAQEVAPTLSKERKEKAATEGEAGELSEEALEMVAGGQSNFMQQRVIDYSLYTTDDIPPPDGWEQSMATTSLPKKPGQVKINNVPPTKKIK